MYIWLDIKLDMKLLGRKIERESLDHLYNSKDSKLVAVYGRRRVGKTFLIRKHFENRMHFEISGLFQGDMQDQLKHFTATLIKHGYTHAISAAPDSWIAAFDMLASHIASIKGKKKKVIFLDELPWFDTARSKFLMAFENFWNSFCTRREDILLIICGSAASWMIKKILKNKGGLHNRVSEILQIKPFDLSLTKKFLRQKGIIWSKYDITQLYLCVGGIPFYLDAVRKGESVAQFIQRSCFEETGILYREFENLYASLFSNHGHHEKIVKFLSTKRKGYTRAEIMSGLGITSGGTLSKTLGELSTSHFIELYIPYDGSQYNQLHRLTDHFTLFYFKFMTRNQKRNRDNWRKKLNNPAWKSWAGFAFENLCFAHISAIKYALGLSAIEAHVSDWRKIDKVGDGVQIDMLIDRADRNVNVCEIKFYQTEFVITKEYAKNLRKKLSALRELKSNKFKSLYLTMITTYGVSENPYSLELVQNQITLEDLFVSRN